MVASFVILILFEPLKTKVEEKVLSIFFAERFHFVQALSALRQRMAGIIDVRELAQGVLDGFYETRRVTHASIYLLADDGLGFRRLDFRGPAPTPYIDAATVRALVQSAQSGQKAQLVELVERRLAELRQLLPESETESSALSEERTRLSEIGAAMAAMRAGVTIPLVAMQRVVGFLCVLDDRVPEAFASDELAAMLEVGDQAAITIENSRLYEKMKERDRLAALGEMAAGLAHEIRNPLGAIKGAAQYLDPAQLQGGDGEILQIIVEEVNRLDGVVAQFLDYSRPFPSAASGKFQSTDLNDVLWKTMKLIESSMPANVVLELDLTPGLPPIHADAEQLKQVFINLALNAVQAMPDGGRLTVRTRRPHAPIELGLSEHTPRYSADQLEVRFADTGAGIPEDALDRIFIPFYTTKTKGTGLGLAISQRIVKGHGGTIEVQSRVGEGTEFILRFPSASALDTAGRLGMVQTPLEDRPPAPQRLVGQRRAGPRRDGDGDARCLQHRQVPGERVAAGDDDRAFLLHRRDLPLGIGDRLDDFRREPPIADDHLDPMTALRREPRDGRRCANDGQRAGGDHGGAQPGRRAELAEATACPDQARRYPRGGEEPGFRLDLLHLEARLQLRGVRVSAGAVPIDGALVRLVRVAAVGELHPSERDEVAEERFPDVLPPERPVGIEHGDSARHLSCGVANPAGEDIRNH
jgi:signal transduction histidine kinase